VAAALFAGTGVLGGKPGSPKQPPRQGGLRAKRRGGPGQQQKDGLSGILGQRGVVDFAQANSVDEVQIAGGERGKGFLRVFAGIAAQQQPVRRHRVSPFVSIAFFLTSFF